MESTAPGTNILVPFDGSARSAEAYVLARGLAVEGATLTSLLVVADDDPDAPKLRAELEEVTAKLRDDAGNRLRVESEVRSGKPADAILASTHDSGANLIVMSTRGRGGLARLAFGSTAHDVIQRSDVSLAIIHSRQGDDQDAGEAVTQPVMTFRRIILPIDGTSQSLAAVPFARDLARRLGTSVVIVSTVDLVPMTSPTAMQTAGMAENVEMAYEESRESAEEWLQETQKTLEAAGIQASTEFLTGRPSVEIDELARPGDLIVMATGGKGRIERLLTGSVSDELIRSGVAPVMICRRRG